MITTRSTSTAMIMLNNNVDSLIMSTAHGNIEFRVLNSDTKGERFHSDGIRRFTLNFDVPVQNGLLIERCCRIEAYTMGELQRMAIERVQNVCANILYRRQMEQLKMREE